MKMKDITVLTTCSNGLISPSQIQCLRSVKERDIKIIGVDSGKEGAGSRMVDKFYIVPSGFSDEYADRIFSICKEENVDVVVPGSDEEVANLSKEKERFRSINTVIVTNDYETIMQASDKGSLCLTLQKNGLPHAGFRIPKSIEEFETACVDLGFPEKSIVIKPRLGRGNRGFRIIQSKIKKGDLLLNHKPGTPYISLEDVKAALTSDEIKTFPDIIVMEYLPGLEYSTDVLVKDGKPLVMVPKKRLLAVPGLSIIGQVDFNPEVIKMVEDICALFKFNYNVNIQARYGEDGKLYPYEVNTRIAATIGACNAAGANLLYYGIKLALGEDLPEKVEVTDGMKLLRYYKEFYEFPDDKGNSI